MDCSQTEGEGRVDKRQGWSACWEIKWQHRGEAVLSKKTGEEEGEQGAVRGGGRKKRKEEIEADRAKGRCGVRDAVGRRAWGG